MTDELKSWQMWLSSKCNACCTYFQIFMRSLCHYQVFPHSDTRGVTMSANDLWQCFQWDLFKEIWGSSISVFFKTYLKVMEAVSSWPLMKMHYRSQGALACGKSSGCFCLKMLIWCDKWVIIDGFVQQQHFTITLSADAAKTDSRKNKQGNDLCRFIWKSLHALLIDLVDNIKAVPHSILVLANQSQSEQCAEGRWNRMPLCLNCPYPCSTRVLSTSKCISTRVQTCLNSEAINNTNWPSNKLDMRFNVQMKSRPRFSFSSVRVHMCNTHHAFIQNTT